MSLFIVILIPLIVAFGVVLFVAGYLGVFSGGDKPEEDEWRPYWRPWLYFHGQSTQFIVIGLAGAGLLLLVYLLAIWLT